MIYKSQNLEYNEKLNVIMHYATKICKMKQNIIFNFQNLKGNSLNIIFKFQNLKGNS